MIFASVYAIVDACKLLTSYYLQDLNNSKSIHSDYNHPKRVWPLGIGFCLLDMKWKKVKSY